ncbi:hypothetical protein [Neptuniibacter halophilus]|uniref:hypothetical protein n=1 Tax=Neptuniibacter halophilus TaxID=651666 RepID=UPI0025735BAC|nr:hypothetical protein [Neptuniibacter halophilus]
MNKVLLSSILAVSLVAVEAQARLVIIQDDSVIQARKEQAANAAKVQAIKEQEAERQRLLQESEMKIRNATVQFEQTNYQVIADRTEKVIKHFGVPPKQLPALGGAALDSPFWMAMNAIVPTGWKVYLDNAVDAHLPVSWSGQRFNWIAILHQLGVQKRLAFDIDWNQQVVLVRKRSSAIDYLREQHQARNSSQEFLITVDSENSESIPEGGEGVLVINGQPVKVKRTERLGRPKERQEQ